MRSICTMLVARNSSVANVRTGCHNKDVMLVLPSLKNIESAIHREATPCRREKDTGQICLRFAWSTDTATCPQLLPHLMKLTLCTKFTATQICNCVSHDNLQWLECSLATRVENKTCCFCGLHGTDPVCSDSSWHFGNCCTFWHWLAETGKPKPPQITDEAAQNSNKYYGSDFFHENGQAA